MNGEVTPGAYDRTTTYYIDENGVVQQVFPMLIHMRAGWPAILSEIERIEKSAKGN